MNRKRPAAASPADPPRLTVAQTWRQLLANDFFRETIALGPPSRWPRHPILRPVVLALALVPSMVWSARNFGYYGDADFWNERTGRIWALSGLIYLLAAGAQRVNASNWMRERRDQIAPGDRAHSPSADKIALGYVFPNIAGERMGIVLAALIIAWKTAGGSLAQSGDFASIEPRLLNNAPPGLRGLFF
jgi:hypothetical protein